MNNKEKILREHIRTAILLSEIKKRKEVFRRIDEDRRLRLNLRQMIMEVATDAEDDPHPKTGINRLREMIGQTNILKTLRSAYKSLTTNPNQRKSFRAHMITWVIDTLAPLEATEMAGPPIKGEEEAVPGDLAELEPIAEGLGIDIVTPEDEAKSLMGDFPDADGGEEAGEELPEAEDEEPEEESSKYRQLEDYDTTGRNVAKRVYKVIEKSIVQYYNEIGRNDVEDRELYRDWLVANLKLFFNKWENELQPSVEEPTNDEYEQSKDNIQRTASGEELAGAGATPPPGGIPDLETKAAQ